jgi:hypothetical protein
LFGVLVGFYVFDDAFDTTVFINDKRSARNAHVRATHESFFAPYTIGFGYSVVFICNQREGQVVLFSELDVFFCRIGAYAENFVAFSDK